MSSEPVLNLLGALGLGVTDLLLDAAAGVAGHGGQSAAAVVTLGAEPGMTVGRLAMALGLSQPGTVRLVDRLAREGLVVRGKTTADARTVALRLTAEGSARRDAILLERAGRLGPVIEVLTAGERRGLEALLRKLLAGMTTDVARSYALCRLCDQDRCMALGCPVEAACARLEDP
jgi:MarR family transcriptional regulator, negative regulator of the multidrug operon emrRAB